MEKRFEITICNFCIGNLTTSNYIYIYAPSFVRELVQCEQPSSYAQQNGLHTELTGLQTASGIHREDIPRRCSKGKRCTSGSFSTTLHELIDCFESPEPFPCLASNFRRGEHSAHEA